MTCTHSRGRSSDTTPKHFNGTRNIAGEQQKSVKSWRDIVAVQAGALANQRLLSDEHRDLVGLLKQRDTVWNRIQRTSSGAAKTIKDMTSDILKWVPVLSALAGVG